MLKRLFYIVLIAVSAVACTNKTQHQEYTMRGSVYPPDLEGDKVVLYALTSGSEPMPLDSTDIADGGFFFSGVAPLEPSNVLMVIVDDETGENSGIDRVVVLEPGEIEITVDSNYFVEATGTPINEMEHVCEKAMLSYQDTCNALLKMDCSSDERRAMMTRARSERNSKMMKVILPNINYAVTQKIISDHYTLFSSDELDVFYEAIDNKSDERTREFRTGVQESVIGRKLGEVNIPDADSNMVCLQEVFAEHDYTLMDFWASWCGPCMRNMIELKSLYARYEGSRFEVVGVSLDDNKRKWQNAIKNVDGGWLDVSYLSGWNCDLSRRLNIDFVPATVLFDRNGMIVLRNPSYAELEIMLAQ